LFDTELWLAPRRVPPGSRKAGPCVQTVCSMAVGDPPKGSGREASRSTPMPRHVSEKSEPTEGEQ
jgi:hypothetical protein